MRAGRAFWVGLQLDAAIVVGSFTASAFVWPELQRSQGLWAKGGCVCILAFWCVLVVLRVLQMRREQKELEDHFGGPRWR